MDSPNNDWATRIVKGLFVGASLSFIGWAYISFSLTFQPISLNPEDLRLWVQALWGFGFLTLLFAVLAIGVLAWRKS